MNDDAVNKVCPACGGENRCTKDANCWCMRKPLVAMPERETACLCEACLAKLRAETPRDEK